MNKAYRRLKVLNGGGSSTIRRLIHNRSVIGCFTAKNSQELANYFPAVISAKDFKDAQDKCDERPRGGGKLPDNGWVNNIFQGIVYCGFCCGKMGWRDKGEGYQVLLCNKFSRGGGCQGNHTRYSVAELKFLLEIVDTLKMFDGCLVKTDVDLLLAKRLEKEKELDLMIEDMRKGGFSPKISTEIRRLEDENKVLTEQINEDLAITPGYNGLGYWDLMKNFVNMRESTDGRLKLRAELQS